MQSFSLLVKWLGTDSVFAQVLYLAVQNPALLLAEIQKAVWQSIIQGDEEATTRFKLLETGDVGFVRDGKDSGCTSNPGTFTPAELIRKLPT